MLVNILLTNHYAHRFLTATVMVLLMATLGSVRSVAAPMAPESVPFVDKIVAVNGEDARFEVFVPKRWDKSKSWPVIVFLHGIGECGEDGKLQTKNGIRLLIAQDPDNFPCIVVCPQCRVNKRWTQPEMQDLALKALDECIADYHGDTSRVYLTGLSLGGYGTWEMARKYPERWAAIAPVCGGIVYPAWVGAPATENAAAEHDPYQTVAGQVSKIPAWVFHGAIDGTVPVSESRQLAASLLALKADIHYTEYAGVDHNSWDYAYAEHGLLPWLLSHKRGK